jgi:lipopolysaccharide biosynthesis glycosyltransferase
LFKDLNLKGEKYFNAGIMFIDLEKWRKIEINHKAERIIEDDNIEFKFWDQDILNILFDGDYLELEKKFNYAVDVENFSVNKNSIMDKAVLIHYSGSKKPWTVEGLLNNTSNFYQENYRKLGFEKIHITHKWKKYSTLLFLKNILNLRLQKNYKTVELLKSFYRSLNSKRIKK